MENAPRYEGDIEATVVGITDAEGGSGGIRLHAVDVHCRRIAALRNR
jgi:hypothetical protein